MEANEVQEYAKQMKEAGEIGGEPFRFLAIAATPRRS
jgi:hypothetical protein